MTDLPHFILDIIKQEDCVGGLRAPAIVNRVIAHCAKERIAAPSEDVVLGAIFDMLSAGSIRLLDDKRLRMPKEFATKFFQIGKSPSGMHPCGVGDRLYNSEGKAVAVVKILRIDVGVDGSRATMLEVAPLFDPSELYALDGTRIPDCGEVMGPSWQREVVKYQEEKKAIHNDMAVQITYVDAYTQHVYSSLPPMGEAK